MARVKAVLRRTGPDALEQQTRQVAVAIDVLAKHNQVPGTCRVVFIGDAQIGTDNRFETCRDSLAIKLDHREQVVLIRHRNGRHAVGGTALHQ